ncbi:SDR family NAD(P)-dependent oxidoreductase [Neobacillus cucumis]|uniref:Short-chain dehydrogenase n=1 Tax=Neobacillus cucumis TaxID=1740721 RepID=A0A2N5H6E0_9BACI|nr:SDR family NAD(P)-dependent oxidoreductase [Neobacillus cucumis]PLS01068.1 short-chain dehydrogenase [Neobacillus cucumis]
MRILITGANRGLGLALSQVGAERGHHILAGVRDAEQGRGKLSELEFSKSISIVSLDVTKEDSVLQAANFVKEHFGSIDAIINNAGILLERDKTIEDLNLEEVQLSFDVNLFGPMRVVKHFLPLLLMGDSSSIINISSEAGSFENAYGGDYAYASSKTALNMFSEQLSNYVKEKNIQVYAVHPGWIQTDMGGVNAPGNPIETAKGIFDLIEKRKIVESKYCFINHDGSPMPI